MRKLLRESGAAAVEFALVLPLLLILLAGIVDFGRAFYTQVVLTNAAREGARLVAMDNEGDLPARMTSAYFGINLAYTVVDSCSGATGSDVGRITVRPNPSDPFTWIFLDDILTILPGGSSLADPDLDATGVMRCFG